MRVKIKDFKNRAESLGGKVRIKRDQSIGDYLLQIGNKYGLFTEYTFLKKKPGIGLNYLNSVYKMLDLASRYLDEESLGDNTDKARLKIDGLSRLIINYIFNPRDKETLSSMDDNINDIMKLVDETVEG
ncbi:MAG: hypothetical protein ISS93_00765 [Candidatus Aenigmarchaeota archaeon]|nr:hypothetical protein [Candidatus Aenigmarchaeota archaeon]